MCQFAWLKILYRLSSLFKGFDVLRGRRYTRKQFDAKLIWPAKNIYIRSFKYDSELEVWVRNSVTENLSRLKPIRLCFRGI
jgi:hypothetical protein